MTDQETNIVLAFRKIADNTTDEEIKKYGDSACRLIICLGFDYIYNIMKLTPNNKMVKPYYDQAIQIINGK